ncbi:MAG: ribosomal protein S18-alanine N-acetyltransferase [Clostridia bacterium]|nr:ribosomal protein S18-alanine N-acetyltransferase [Clostridia bacterium]
MNIRPVSSDDIAFLASFKAAFPDAWDENMLKSAFRAGNFYGFIAEESVGENDTPVGFITYSVNIDDADLQDLFVTDSYRNRGVGSALINEFIAGAKDRGARKLFLEVRESNLKAQRLYCAAGFKKISVRNKYYSDGENAFVYIKEL